MEPNIRLAEACERAAVTCLLAAGPQAYRTSQLQDRMESDAAKLRALAMALRGAEREDPIRAPNDWSITLGDP